MAGARFAYLETDDLRVVQVGVPILRRLVGHEPNGREMVDRWNTNRRPEVVSFHRSASTSERPFHRSTAI